MIRRIHLACALAILLLSAAETHAQGAEARDAATVKLENAQKAADAAHKAEQAQAEKAAAVYQQLVAAREKAEKLRDAANALKAKIAALPPQAPPADEAALAAAPVQPALQLLQEQAATADADATRQENEVQDLSEKNEQEQRDLIALVEESKKKDAELQEARSAAEVEQKTKHGVDVYLDARCASALCFGENKWLGIEPLVELPIAKSFAIGNSSLAQYINNHDITLQLAAGFRIWLFRDLVSFAGYLSIPLSSSGVRVEGSEFTYPGASIRRPYPGIAIGLLYDIIWIGIDHDELRNGDSSDASAYNPEYPANARVSSCTTISVALQPVTAARALFGAIQSKGKD